MPRDIDVAGIDTDAHALNSAFPTERNGVQLLIVFIHFGIESGSVIDIHHGIDITVIVDNVLNITVSAKIVQLLTVFPDNSVVSAIAAGLKSGRVQITVGIGDAAGPAEMAIRAQRHVWGSIVVLINHRTGTAVVHRSARRINVAITVSQVEEVDALASRIAQINGSVLIDISKMIVTSLRICGIHGPIDVSVAYHHTCRFIIIIPKGRNDFIGFPVVVKQDGTLLAG